MKDTINMTKPKEHAEFAVQDTPRKEGRFALWCKKYIWRKENISRLVFAAGPVVAYGMVEVLNNNNPFTSLSIDEVVLNLVWYFLIYGFFWFLIGRRNLAAGSASVFCFLLGLANHYVLEFRGRVIFPCDLVAFRTALNVAGGFDYTPTRRVIAAFVLLIVYLIVLCIVPRVHGRCLLRRKVLLPVIGVVTAFLYFFFGSGMLSSLGIYVQQWKTQQNGFLLNFMTALSYSFVQAPTDYSAEAAQKIANEVPIPGSDASVKRPQNLIVIMNESFADMTDYKSLEMTDDPTPFLHSMKENTMKGTMYSPVTGGGTANVEFEYLTGDSLPFLPPATVAYQLYLYDGVPSLAWQAKSLGYSTAAFHPYESSGWNRVSAYAWLGFDRQYYQEDVQNPQYIRDYVSDSSDYQQIYRWTDESEEPMFIFNVTMQNHSGYDQGWNNLDKTVSLDGASKGTSLVAAQYLSLMRASDDALRELIEHYSASEEDTMIVFFGDHQPPLENSFFESLYDKPLDSRSTSETLLQYGVPFFIWANYDIPEQQDMVISSNFLGALTAQTAGFPLSGYEEFLLEGYEQMPVVTTVGYISDDGSVLSSTMEMTEQQRKWYEEYKLLAYNHLFDEKGHPAGFYSEKGAGS